MVEGKGIGIGIGIGVVIGVLFGVIVSSTMDMYNESLEMFV